MLAVLTVDLRAVCHVLLPMLLALRTELCKLRRCVYDNAVTALPADAAVLCTKIQTSAMHDESGLSESPSDHNLKQNDTKRFSACSSACVCVFGCNDRNDPSGMLISLLYSQGRRSTVRDLK